MPQIKDLSAPSQAKLLKFAQQWIGPTLNSDTFHTWNLDMCVGAFSTTWLPGYFLHFAITEDEVELVDELCELKVNINQRDNCFGGRTPLQVACDYGRHNIVETLIKFGANQEGISLDYDMRQPLTFLWCMKELFMARNANYEKVADAFATQRPKY